MISALKRLGYKETRQTGGHVRMTINVPRQAHLTVPLTRAIPWELSQPLIKEAATQWDMTVDDILTKIR